MRFSEPWLWMWRWLWPWSSWPWWPSSPWSCEWRMVSWTNPGTVVEINCKRTYLEPIFYIIFAGIFTFQHHMLEQEWLVGKVIFNSGFCLGEFNYVQLYHWREKRNEGFAGRFFQLYLYINLYQDSIWAYYHLKAWKNNPDPQLPWISWSNWQSENLGWFDIHDPIDGFGPQKTYISAKYYDSQT